MTFRETPDDDIKNLLTESMTPEPPMAATVGDAVHRGRTLRRRRRVATAVGAALGVMIAGGTAYGVANLAPGQDQGFATRPTTSATPRATATPTPSSTPSPTTGRRVEHSIVRPSTTMVCFKDQANGAIDVFPKGTTYSENSSAGYFIDWPVPDPWSRRSTDLRKHEVVTCPPGSVVSEDKLGPLMPWQNVVVERLGSHYVPNSGGGPGLGRWEDGNDLGTVAVDVYHHDDPLSEGPKNYYMSKGPDGELCAITPAKGSGRERFRWTSCESEKLANGDTLKIGTNANSRGVSLFREDGTVVTISVSKAYFEGGESLDELPVSEETMRAVVTDPGMLER